MVNEPNIEGLIALAVLSLIGAGLWLWGLILLRQGRDDDASDT